MRALTQLTLNPDAARPMVVVASKSEPNILLAMTSSTPSYITKFDNPEDAISKIDELLADIARNFPRKDITNNMTKIDKKGVERENARRDEAVKILNEMKEDVLSGRCKNENRAIIASYDDIEGKQKEGKPNGFLSMSRDLSSDGKRAYIAHMATLPGTKGVGRKLVEHAAQQSEKWGLNGRLKAIQGNPAAKAFYKALSFRFSVSVGHMTLDPKKIDPKTKSNLWIKKGSDEWKIKKYLHDSV